MQYADLYTQNKISPHMLRAIGFQEAPISSLPYHLLQTQPAHNNSCLRDTILTTLQNYYRLQRVLVDAGTINRWKFYNIILCSLPDKISKISRKEILLEISRLNNMWKCASFKCFFIPIGMNNHDVEEIIKMCEAGGLNWVAYPTTFSNFYEQFKYVMSEIGLSGNDSLLTSQASESTYSERTEKWSLAVTLNVEASEMMKGQNWQTLNNTLSFYLRKLGPRDIVSGIIFSAAPWVVTLQPPQRSQEPAQYQQEVMNQGQRQRVEPHLACLEPRFSKMSKLHHNLLHSFGCSTHIIPRNQYTVYDL